MQLPGKAFHLHTDESALSDLYRRLDQVRWPETPSAAGWRQGSSLPYMQRLVEHWRNRFDWRAWEHRINGFEQRLVEVDGQTIHVLVEPGSGDDPLPLLLTHGWPGSFLEFIDIIEPLAHPERFGGRIEDAFTVVLPSLPGYGFSPAPKEPLGPRAIAGLWSRLAIKHFGFRHYVIQGGDWGAVVGGLLARLHPQGLLAAHLNMLGCLPALGADSALTPEEGAWLARLGALQQEEGAYQQVQGIKPQSLAYALTDSPVGLAGWIVDKFQAWTLGASEEDPPFAMDWMLANLMLYWLKGINGANWLYQVARSAGDTRIAADECATVPTGFSLFPHDLIPPPPRSFLERVFDVREYRVHARGGHFPALEQGELLVADIREFFRAFR